MYFAQARPEEAETEAVLRACVLASQQGCPALLTSLSSVAATEILAGRKAGQCAVWGEVTAAGLGCDGSEYYHNNWRHAAAYVCSPPLREGEAEGLAAATASGTLDLVSSQHAAYNGQQKALGREKFTGIPAGVTGVEERLLVTWQKAVNTGLMSRQRFVEVTSAEPAKLLNIFPRKGCVAVGSDADIIIWDAGQERTLGRETQLSKCDFNIFEGLACRGGPEFTIFKGRLVTDQGVFRPMTGYGEYQPLPPHAPHLYDRVRARRERSAVRPVARTAADLAIATNGDDTDAVPPPAASEEPRVNNQQRSSVELNNHPASPDFDTAPARNLPSRSSVRVRAPPGGQSSGFW